MKIEDSNKVCQGEEEKPSLLSEAWLIESVMETTVLVMKRYSTSSGYNSSILKATKKQCILLPNTIKHIHQES